MHPLRINFDLRDAVGIATYHAFMEEAADLVVSYGGSLSGEHGDGQARAEFLTKISATNSSGPSVSSRPSGTPTTG